MDLKESLKYIKLRESIISMLVGVVVVVMSIALIYKYFSPQTQIVSDFQNLKIGEVTPNLTSAFPTDTNTASTPSLTPVVTITPVLDNPGNVTSTSTEAKSHVVAAGESLWTISEKYFQSGYNWVDIAESNKLTKPGMIAVGQTLFIPNVNPKTATIAAPDTTVVNPISDATYTIQKGDSLWNIAVRAYGDGFKYSEIVRENNISTPNIIHPGVSIKIPRNLL